MICKDHSLLVGSFMTVGWLFGTGFEYGLEGQPYPIPSLCLCRIAAKSPKKSDRLSGTPTCVSLVFNGSATD